MELSQYREQTKDCWVFPQNEYYVKKQKQQQNTNHKTPNKTFGKINQICLPVAKCSTLNLKKKITKNKTKQQQQNNLIQTKPNLAHSAGPGCLLKSNILFKAQTVVSFLLV